MTVLRLFLASLLLSLARAQVFSTSGLTLTFAPDGSSCETVKNETTGNGVSFFLDSSQIPEASLCVNLKDMFSQNSTTQTGTVNNDAAFVGPNSANLSPKPAHASANWTSYGGNNYQPDANYTNVWYYQQNMTGKIGEGQNAVLEVLLYPFEGCVVETPSLYAYRYGCQSSTDGQCNIDDFGIKSIGFSAINQTAAESSGSCDRFGKFPSAGERAFGSVSLLLAAVVLMSILAFLWH